MLEFHEVGLAYPESSFYLEHISFKLQQREILGLLGKNGTGKSTILKLANALIPFQSGEISYLGQPYSQMSSNQLRNLRKEVVYIFQEANLLEHKTVYYHLSLIYKLNRQPVDNQRIDEILAFMELTRLKYAYCIELSGGQKQKVAIAMAILQGPKILLCDEISSALDADAEAEIFDLLKQIIDQYDVAIMMISHNLTVLKNFCNRVLFLENGTIRDEITPKAGTANYREDYYQDVVSFLHA